MDSKIYKTFLDYPDELKKSMEILRYFDNNIMLAGSANIKSLKYFGDYDLVSLIEKKGTVESSYKEFERILKEMDQQNFLNLYEIKVQLKNGKKIREFPSFENWKKIFKNIDLVKFDYILYSDYIYYELSSLYPFNSEKKESTEKENRKSFLDDIVELKKENKYYKILKRIYSLSLLNENEKDIKLLNKFFNNRGLDYRIMSNLEAIEKIFEIDKNEKTLERIKKNLNLIHTNPSNIKNKINSKKELLNKIAKKFYYKNFEKID
jgi:hypothetical protein